jgi:hypothetical protein
MSVRLDCCSGEFFFAVLCDLRLSVFAKVTISVVLKIFFQLRRIAVPVRNGMFVAADICTYEPHTCDKNWQT